MKELVQAVAFSVFYWLGAVWAADEIAAWRERRARDRADRLESL